ncbi:hypothetical protein HDU91_002256, partial [Kappamyces sp. JEL0680]
SEFGKFRQLNPVQDKKRKPEAESRKSPFPFKRIPFALSQLHPGYSKSVMVPVAGLSTSYLSQFIACDILKTPKHPDYFPTVLLAEILSKAEGPLYVGIRGYGYAYGASLNCYLWSGQMAFDLYRTSEPQKATKVFYDIIQRLDTDEGFDELCSPFEIETAQSSLAYRWVSNGATASSLLATCLRSSLQGFAHVDEYLDFIQDLYKVTARDLRRVVRSTLVKFLDPEQRVTVLATIAGDATETVRESFVDESVPPRCRVAFDIVPLGHISEK